MPMPRLPLPCLAAVLAVGCASPAGDWKGRCELDQPYDVNLFLEKAPKRAIAGRFGLFGEDGVAVAEGNVGSLEGAPAVKGGKATFFLDATEFLDEVYEIEAHLDNKTMDGLCFRWSTENWVTRTTGPDDEKMFANHDELGDFTADRVP